MSCNHQCIHVAYPGPVGPTGATGAAGPAVFASTFLYATGTYLVNPAVLGNTGLAEFETVAVERSSAGPFIYQSITANGTNITGVSVPIAGLYELEFSLTGQAINIGEEGGLFVFGVGLNGLVVASIPGNTSTVFGTTAVNGSGFMDAAQHIALINGSILLNLTTTDVVHIINLSELLFPTQLITTGTNLIPPNTASLKLNFLE